MSTALNPIVLVEVTSDSSEDYDPSIEEYIVVAHRERRITVHHRRPGQAEDWSATVGVRGGSVEIHSLGTIFDDRRGLPRAR